MKYKTIQKHCPPLKGDSIFWLVLYTENQDSNKSSPCKVPRFTSKKRVAVRLPFHYYRSLGLLLDYTLLTVYDIDTSSSRSLDATTEEVEDTLLGRSNVLVSTLFKLSKVDVRDVLL